MSNNSDDGFSGQPFPPGFFQPPLSNAAIKFLLNAAVPMILNIAKYKSNVAKLLDEIKSEMGVFFAEGKWRYDLSVGSPFAYLKGIVRITCLRVVDQSMKERRDVSLTDVDEPFVVPADPPMVPAADTVTRFREKITAPSDLLVFDEIIMGNKSAQEVQKQHGLNVSVIYQRKHRILERLKFLFADDFESFFDGD